MLTYIPFSSLFILINHANAHLLEESVKFRCPICCAEGETCVDLLPEVKKVKGSDGDKKKTKFQEEIEKLKMLQFQNHAVEDESSQKKDGDGDVKKDDSTKVGVEEQRKNAQPDEASVNVKPSPTSPPQQPKKNEPSTNPSTDNPQIKVSSSAGERDSKNVTAVQPNATPNPPAQTNNNAAPAPQRRPPAVEPHAANNNNNFAVAADAPIISDSLLNGMIGFFAVIVIVLLRQSQALVDELQRLGRDD